jgi:hypothetical protein
MASKTRAPKPTPDAAAAGVVTTLHLTRADEPGRKFTKFSTGEWQSGQINAAVYVPNTVAESVTAITLTVRQ